MLNIIKLFISKVTGTLRSISENQKNLLRNKFKIENLLYVPSIYGKNNLIFSKSDLEVRIEPNSDEHFMRIFNDIIGKSDKTAILVFFENEDSLNDFSNYLLYTKNATQKQNEVRLQVIKESLDKHEIDNCIHKAVLIKTVTLLTRSFGRGIDFKVYDDEMNRNGGVHVIQTFFSEDTSEEIQIKGRTARQGGPGTFSLILNLDELEKFEFTTEDYDKIKGGISAYNYLDRQREKKNVLKNDTEKEINEFMKKTAKLSEDFLKHLVEFNKNEIDKFLLFINKGPVSEITSRTICLVDATGSMSNLLEKTKAILFKMFEKINEIFKNNNIQENSNQLQFVAFRNYNAGPTEILVWSEWQSNPTILKQYLDNIKPKFGLGNEAIEVALQYCNKEFERSPFNQIILIGDAPPNTQEEIDKGTSEYQFNYKMIQGFQASKTFYLNELESLCEKKIKIHAFYLKSRAKAIFEEIATKTGGNFKRLDIRDESKGVENLLNIFTEQILQNVDEVRGLDGKLLKEYKDSLKVGHY